MCCVADLAGGFVLSILVGVGSSLGEEYNKQHSQSEGQHPGPAPYGFSPKSHKPCHFNTASDWTRRPNHSKRQLNPAQRSGTYLTCSMSCSGRAAYAIIADDRNHGCAGSHSRRAVARKSEIFCRSFSTMPAVTSCSTEIPSA